MTNHNITETHQNLAGPQSSKPTWSVIDVENITTSRYRDTVQTAITLQFAQMVSDIADSTAWPVTCDQMRSRVHAELVQRRHLRAASDRQVLVEGPVLESDGSKLDFLVTIDDLHTELCAFAIPLTAGRTPREQLIASLDGELEPIAKIAVEFALSVDAAA